jgi:hypothetical protein
MNHFVKDPAQRNQVKQGKGKGGRFGLQDELQLLQGSAPTEEEGLGVPRLGGFHVTGVPADQ